jgi:hypothetical protein
MTYKAKSKTKLTKMEELRKRDALLLAQLILDIYQENKIKGSPNVDKD